MASEMKNECRNCRFWEPFGSAHEGARKTAKDGECRRYAPKARSMHLFQFPTGTEPSEAGAMLMTHFPNTLPDEWCGEHEQPVYENNGL